MYKVHHLELFKGSWLIKLLLLAFQSFTTYYIDPYLNVGDCVNNIQKIAP